MKTPAEPTPRPQPGEFVGAVCPTCGAWGTGLCTTATGRDHRTRRAAEVAWSNDLESEAEKLATITKERA